MSTIDTVIFDIGNVLIRWEMHNLYRRLFADETAMRAFLDETRLAEVNHHQLDAGAQTFAEATGALAKRFPAYRDALLAFDTRWEDCLAGPIEANVAVLRDLKAAGVPTHAITNFSEEKFDVACRLFPFLTTFDETIVSGAVKLVKPDAAIFRVLFDRRGIDPARTVFIDDSAANIATAKALGLNTVHFVEATGIDLRRELVAMGVAGI